MVHFPTQWKGGVRITDKELYMCHVESLESDEGKEANMLLAIVFLVFVAGGASAAVDAVRKPAAYLPFSSSCEYTCHGSV